MADRPAAPGPRPPGEAPPRREPPAPRPDDDDDDWTDDGEELPDELFAQEWPDDDDEPLLPDEPPGDAEPELAGFPLDDEVEPASDAGAVDADALEDLVAADDTDIPVIDPELTVRIDGRSLGARVDWTRTGTVWVRPAGAGPDREVTLELAGRRLAVTVQVLAGDQEIVLLGRDLLKGRFLLRA